MPDKSPEEIEADKRGAERAAAHKEMKLAMGTSAHHAAVRKHILASEAHAKALIIAQKAATRSRK
jgi:glucosamine 6-phosphate synthetase-like amidotransferase/phosphosugar isomerase protein